MIKRNTHKSMTAFWIKFLHNEYSIFISEAAT